MGEAVDVTGLDCPRSLMRGGRAQWNLSHAFECEGQRVLDLQPTDGTGAIWRLVVERAV